MFYTVAYSAAEEDGQENDRMCQDQGMSALVSETRPRCWPEHAATITSIHCSSLSSLLLWLRHSQTMPGPGSTPHLQPGHGHPVQWRVKGM